MKVSGEGSSHRPTRPPRPAPEGGFEEELCERVALEQVQDTLAPELQELLEVLRVEERQEAVAEQLQCNRSRVRRRTQRLYATLKKLLGLP